MPLSLLRKLQGTALIEKAVDEVKRKQAQAIEKPAGNTSSVSSKPLKHMGFADPPSLRGRL